MTDETTPNENDPIPSGAGPEDPRAEQPAAGGPEDPPREQPAASGPEPPTAEPPTAEQPTATTEQTGPRRLYRSRSDRVIGGVCGGIAKYFGIDPVIVRVVAVALIFLGGTGLIAYLAGVLLIPNEGEGGAPAESPRRIMVIAGAILLVCAIGVALPFHGGWWGDWSLVPIGLVAIAGLLVWRLASGQRPEGDARAVLRAMGLGVALIAICFGLAFGSAWAAAGGVSAADIDVKGGYGDKIYRPASIESVRDSYRLGAGKLVVDLRGAHLTPGDHRIKLDLGVGEAQLVVPRGVCVSAGSHLGVGGYQIFNRSGGGFDIDHEDERVASEGTPRVVVDADVGIGAFTVHHTEDEGFNGERGNEACA